MIQRANADLFKFAYFEGAKDALRNVGVLSDEKKPFWRSALPAALGVGGAAALYPLLRRIHLSKIPALRELQQASRGHLTHIALSGIEKTRLGRLLGGERLTRWLRGADDVVIAGTPRAAIERQAPGGVFSTVPEGVEPPIRGTVELGGRASRQMDPRWEDKLFESQQLEKRMPGLSGKAEEVPYFEEMPIPEKLDELQQHMRRTNQILKPRSGSASGDVILPTDDLQKIFAEGGQRAQWLRGAMDEPFEYILQERIPIQYERRLPGSIFGKSHPGRKQVPREFRVHVVNGVIVPEGITQRTPGISTLNPFRQHRIKKEIVQQLQPHIQNLPRDITHNQVLPLDVVQTPQGGYRVIELNAGGGYSGFMAPEGVLAGQHGSALTAVPHGVYKAITGRASKPAALTKALVGGGALASAAGVGDAALD